IEEVEANQPPFSIFWRRLMVDAKVTDLHFHDLRHTLATWLQNLGVPLEVRATLLGHRLPGGDIMTRHYSHGGYGWNQQLREAVMRLQTALLSYGLSYGIPTDEAITQPKVANSRKDLGKGWWSQRDLNPCLNSTTPSPFIVANFEVFCRKL